MNYQDLLYYWSRFLDDPGRLLKIITSHNARGILLHLPFETSRLTFLNSFTPINQSEIDKYIKEYQQSVFYKEFRNEYLKIRNKKFLTTQKWHELIYILIRKIKPNTIVETGVFDGTSSFFILLALKNNKKGRLCSIDLPAKKVYQGSTNEMWATTLPPEKTPGWVVPDGLRNRWELYLGSSKDYLPKVIKKIINTDIFIHDSMHTYNYMFWEYETAWKALSKGGLLCSDDIFICRAFADFNKKKKQQSFQKGGFGIIRK